MSRFRQSECACVRALAAFHKGVLSVLLTFQLRVSQGLMPFLWLLAAGKQEKKTGDGRKERSETHN